MNDQDIILNIASIWIDCGGDSDGFCYTWQKILAKIRELEQEGERDE